jgi:hypothetical protein
MTKPQKTTSQKSTRRDFIRTSALAAGAGMTLPYFPWTAKAFANQEKNDRPLIACIGTGSMGTGDAKGHNNFGDIVAVCDVDTKHAEKAKADEQIGKGKADIYTDYREVWPAIEVGFMPVVNRYADYAEHGRKHKTYLDIGARSASTWSASPRSAGRRTASTFPSGR